MENDGLPTIVHEDLARYLITEKLKELTTYCKSTPEIYQLTDASISFVNNEIVINSIKCGSCNCEPYLK